MSRGSLRSVSSNADSAFEKPRARANGGGSSDPISGSRASPTQDNVGALNDT